MSPLRLSVQELAFYRLTLDIFPSVESPLRFLQDQDLEPEDAGPRTDRPGPMPPDDGVRPHDHQRVGSARPEPAEHDPEGPVGGTDAGRFASRLERGELLAQGQVLQDQIAAGPEGGDGGLEDDREDAAHGRGTLPGRVVVGWARRKLQARVVMTGTVRTSVPPPAENVYDQELEWSDSDE